MKKYLLFVSHSYAYSILRPLQTEIQNRGDVAAWFIEDTSPIFLKENEIQLKTIKEVFDYNPYAILAPGNHIYDFFPGLKVEIFHGLYYKRVDYGDHYRIRGFFDIYCTTGPLFTPTFEKLSDKYGYFKVYETGWSKFDAYDTSCSSRLVKDLPTIIYAPTFSKDFCSADILYDKINQLVASGRWKWIFSFHPKMDTSILNKYKMIEKRYANVSFAETEDKQPLYQQADIMLSDTSSVIYEFMWFDKPVVTFRNTFPDTHLVNIQNPSELESAIELAMSRPLCLMSSIKEFMDKIHPFRDRKSSQRILDAIDHFYVNYRDEVKKKPLNLLRNLKLRKNARFFPFGPRIRK